MIPKIQDLILKKKVKLYNNIAQTNDCVGRLLSELEVYHTPRIIWEFEMIGEANCDFPRPNVWNEIIKQRWQFIIKAIQWIDEVLLWRLGYDGEYLDRINRNSRSTPRYDLSLRDSSWSPID
jgi:hypothetical protein